MHSKEVKPELQVLCKLGEELEALDNIVLQVIRNRV